MDPAAQAPGTLDTASFPSGDGIVTGTDTVSVLQFGSGGLWSLGAGASLTATSAITEGDGVVAIGASANITGQGTVDAISGTGGQSAAVIVAGAGASRNSAGRLVIGKAGPGDLSISGSGTVIAAGATIANTTTASGSSASVTGTGSEWQVGGALIVGNAGAGSLNITVGGTVTAVRAKLNGLARIKETGGLTIRATRHRLLCHAPAVAPLPFDTVPPPRQSPRLPKDPPVKDRGREIVWDVQSEGYTPMISALLPNYARADLAFERGEGAWLWTVDGRRFLDFGSGIATTSLGHGHPHLAKTIAEQAAKVMHVSNLYRIPQAERLAARLVEHTFADSVFFCNSGTEANEGMIKMMRKAAYEGTSHDRFRLITFEGAFHGRTLGALAATGNEKYLKGFGPPLEGFDQVPFNNMNAVRNAIGPATAGIIVEPIQGEGGVRSADPQFLRDLRTVCDEYGLILGFDEVQSGMGRTGKLFAYEWSEIEPDVIAAAKGIGGGFPLGAVLAKEAVAKYLVPGTHGTTFGGNPLACAAGNAVLDVMLVPGFMEEVQRKGKKFRAQLDALAREYPQVYEDARGMGLLLGLKCVLPQNEVQAACVAEGLMAITAGDNVLRLAPPLVVTDADLDEAVDMLHRATRRVLPSTAKVAAK